MGGPAVGGAPGPALPDLIVLEVGVAEVPQGRPEGARGRLACVFRPLVPPVRLEFPILSLNPRLRQRCVAPDVWPTHRRRRVAGGPTRPAPPPRAPRRPFASCDAPPRKSAVADQKS